MGDPIVTMARTDDGSRALCGVTQGRSGTRGHASDTFLEERPRRLDRVEIVGVGRQVDQPGASRGDEDLNLARFVRGQIVEHDDIAPAQGWDESPADPGDEPCPVHRPPVRAQREPAIHTNRPDPGQIVAPVHGARFDQDCPAWQPGVRAAHGQIRAGFIEKHQPARVYVSEFPPVGAAPGLDARMIEFRGPGPFLLNTYPDRCRARRMLDRCTRARWGTRRLYARVSSSVVMSGRSWTNAWRADRATGEHQPPPRARGATVPVSRKAWIQRFSVAGPMPTSSATSAYESRRSSYMGTARSRSATGYGFAMHVRDHRTCLNSREVWLRILHISIALGPSLVI